MKIRITVLLAASVLAARPSWGQGSIIVQHSGYTDPVSERFFLLPSSAGLTGPVTNDLERNAWFTQLGNGASNYGYYLRPQEKVNIAGMDWELSATLRILTPYEYGQYQAFFATGSETFSLDFFGDADGNPTVYANGSKFSLPAGSDGYNNYRLVYNTASDTASLWVNGVEEIRNVPQWAQATTPYFMQWGQVYPNNPNSQQANWSEVTLQIIPEPSTLALFGLGGLLLAASRLHRQRLRS